MRLLLVDDNPVLARGVAILLRDAGHEVEVVDRGRLVIGAIVRQLPDALLLDVSLPDVNGIVIGESVHRTWPALPIIFTTGHDETAEIRSALSAPNTALLRKPYAMAALIELLRSFAR